MDLDNIATEEECVHMCTLKAACNAVDYKLTASTTNASDYKRVEGSCRLRTCFPWTPPQLLMSTNGGPDPPSVAAVGLDVHTHTSKAICKPSYVNPAIMFSLARVQEHKPPHPKKEVKL